LRSDNAAERLTPLGIAAGLVGEARAAHFSERKARLDDVRSRLKSLKASPTEARAVGLTVNLDGRARSAFDLLSYPGIAPDDLKRLWPGIADLHPALVEQAGIDAQYAVYLDRQRADIEAVQRDESRAIPEWVDYSALPGLSNEVRQKFMAAQPQTIAQAQAIDGVTPASVTLLLSVIRRGSLRRAG
jgi:tRNA uridine 5-carboxymethylaminomethyl modification enzyme